MIKLLISLVRNYVSEPVTEFFILYVLEVFVQKQLSAGLSGLDLIDCGVRNHEQEILAYNQLVTHPS